jgi:hypothetical protein
MSRTAEECPGDQSWLDLKGYPSSITIQCERYQHEAEGATLVGFPRLVQSSG